jgi:hypothetical protein
MKRFLITSFLLFVSVASIYSLQAVAQQERILDVHFDKAVAVPGKVLLPGDYRFELMDSTSYPDVVEIINKADSKPIGLFRIDEAQRSDYGDSAVLVTAPDSVGLQRIDEWYFPGAQDGYRFVYSQKDLSKLDAVAQRMQVNPNNGL